MDCSTTTNNETKSGDKVEAIEEDLIDEDEDDEEEEEDLDYYYYSFNEDADPEGTNGGSNQLNNNEDPEFTPYDCLNPKEAEKYLQELVDTASNVLKVPPPDAKVILHQNSWSLSESLNSLNQKPNISKKIQAPIPTIPPGSTGSSFSPPSPGQSGQTSSHHFCDVCATLQAKDKFSSLSCNHNYCKSCWELHFENQIEQGSSTGLSCMSINCDTLANEHFVLSHLKHRSAVTDKYLNSAFHDYVRSHPQLRFCPGRNCKLIIRTAKLLAKKCVCSSCKIVFCFQCGGDYHAPTDCETIKRWLTKCADDSETANYISAHTKDCPKCNICIEKNGGCNHVQCYNCKHDFCWMCLGDWKTHGSEYYECSRYKENPNIAHESEHAQAREALKKYLHYFERWENHSKSMKLEAQTLDKIKNKITEKVMEGSGTWIDWQYLLDASALLAKCRYTLQYTYPYAYYMEPSPRKDLFEYQQAQLEAEIENLSWKIEHAESTDRGDLENQIDIAEKRRTSLLKDFLPS